MIGNTEKPKKRPRKGLILMFFAVAVLGCMGGVMVNPHDVGGEVTETKTVTVETPVNVTVFGNKTVTQHATFYITETVNQTVTATKTVNQTVTANRTVTATTTLSIPVYNYSNPEEIKRVVLTQINNLRELRGNREPLHMNADLAIYAANNEIPTSITKYSTQTYTLIYYVYDKDDFGVWRGDLFVGATLANTLIEDYRDVVLDSHTVAVGMWIEVDASDLMARFVFLGNP